MNFFSSKKQNRGFSLIEMIVYIAILSLMLTVIISMLYVISSSGHTLTASKNIENSGATALERVTREIRNATSVDAGQSTLGTSPGVLTLDGTDFTGNPEVVKFQLNGSALHVFANGVDQGSLTSTNAAVTNLVFSQIITSHSQAIRVQMTIESGTSTYYRKENFYSTAILRGSL